MTNTTPAPVKTDSTAVSLAIGGMTCASCAMRIEKKLNKLDGVTATVNYATEQAKVDAPEGVSVDELIAAVEFRRLLRSSSPLRKRGYRRVG
jgi:Cu+-exporting ATPase